MLRTTAVGVVALSAMLTATGALAQPPGPTTYTFVAEWQVPRAQWGAFVADFEKNTRPALEKLAGAGTIVGWGAFETIVHTPEGATHGVWWTSPTIAGVEQTRTTLVKASASSPSLATATAHRDYYMRTLVGNGKAASGTDAYLTVSSQMVKPGQGQEWRQLWDKHNKPIYDDLVAKGIISGYFLDVEHVHTDSPGLRFVVTLSPNAEAEDKIGETFRAASSKLSAEENRSIGLQFQALQEPGAHRDQHMRVIRYWIK